MQDNEMKNSKNNMQDNHQDSPDTKEVYRTQNVYLTSFLTSQEFFELGKVYLEEKDDNKAYMEILYDKKHKPLLDNQIELYEKKKAIVNLEKYQTNIRFIMHLCNARKSGIKGDFNE